MDMEQQHSEDEIWAYLHDALDADARRDLERRMAADAALRARCGQARRLDRLLRADLPRIAAGTGDEEEALAEQVLAAWDRDQQASAASAPAAPPAARARRFRLPPFPQPSLALRLGLAGMAAALLVVALLPALRKPPALPPAAWAPVAFAPLSYRGALDAPPAAGRLGRRDAARMQAALSDAIDWALADRCGRLPDGLTLALRINELPDGAFAAIVRAEDAAGRPLGEWSGDYSCLERFFEQADASAEQIAGALAVPAAAGNSPRRPARK